MREKRLIVPGYPHHVIVRGNNRRRLFSYHSDYLAFFRFLGQGMSKHDCRLHNWVLMTNHVHLSLTPAGLEDLSKLMHYTDMRYAQYRNESHAGTGTLFEGNFLSFPILGEGQLAIVSSYIELNPVRAGMQNHLEYRYSSYALHVGLPTDAPRSLWTPSDWYLGLGTSAAQRAENYARWVAECRARDLAPEKVSLIRTLEAISDRQRDRRVRRPNETRAT